MNQDAGGNDYINSNYIDKEIKKQSKAIKQTIENCVCMCDYR